MTRKFKKFKFKFQIYKKLKFKHFFHQVESKEKRSSPS